MNEEKKWFVVYTKSRCEKKVVENLTKAGIENYLPLRKEIVQWSDRKKEVEKIIIPSYVFVKIQENEHRDVRMINGVVNFVYWQKKPAIVREKEMEDLMDFINSNQQVKIEFENINIGTEIEIKEGVFKNQKAIIQKIHNNKIELLLEFLNLKLVVNK